MAASAPTTIDGLIDALLEMRGITPEQRAGFLQPDYATGLHDPSLLPDMEPAVARIAAAKKANEPITIYGDYDIDGLTATTILREALTAFGLQVDSYIPDRFSEGYGMSVSGVEDIAARGTKLIITVDCGSRSIDEIALAKSLGVDVIVTDHHETGETLPDCIGVVNPKRADSIYPFRELAGVGVAFKLIQALQLELDGLPQGQEKWLLDLVAMGTVCDVMSLTDENRVFVYWGLRVMQKARRPGIQALAASSATDLFDLDASVFGFRFGPRLNAAGRIEHAELGLKLLMSQDLDEAMNYAQQLEELNTNRRNEQRRITEAASEQVRARREAGHDDAVIIVADESWSHGINGIVASRLVELHQRPAFVLQVLDDQVKGSARSFGDFKLNEAIDNARPLLLSGGGHAAAAGVSVQIDKLEDFRQSVLDFYDSLELVDQHKHLRAKTDMTLPDLSLLSLQLLDALDALAPFGTDNSEPIFAIEPLEIVRKSAVGSDKTHAKLTLADSSGATIDGIGFGLYNDLPSTNRVRVIAVPSRNSFRGRTTAQLMVKAVEAL